MKHASQLTPSCRDILCQRVTARALPSSGCSVPHGVLVLHSWDGLLPLESRARPRGRCGQQSATAPAAAGGRGGRKRGLGMRPGLDGTELLQEAVRRRGSAGACHDSVTLGPAGSRLWRRAPVNPTPPYTRPTNRHSPRAPTSAFSSSSSSSSTSFPRPLCSPAPRWPSRVQTPGALGGRELWERRGRSG